MNERLPIPIVVAAENQALAAAWSAMLSGDFACIWRNPAEAPPSAASTILITDSEAPRADPPLSSGESRRGPYVIRIGSDAPADVHLPRDFAPRELLTACRLLAQIAGLCNQLSRCDQQHDRLREQALTDPLTGLPNRRAWDDILEARLAGAAAGRRSLCLAIVDLDHFKAVNDQHGHLVGDDVLCITGKALRASLRQPDLVARLGGDEFGLLLDVPDAAVAGLVVERARKRVATETAAAGRPQVTASLGYCTITESGAAPLPSPDTYIAAADAALRHAKHQGRDRSAAAEVPLPSGDGRS